MSFTALLRREPRALAFGLLHTLAATIGQTFVISLFLPGIKESFALGDAQVSLLFTATTLASAAALWKIGAWFDRADVVRYSLWCGLCLAVSCVVIASAHALALLVLGMFCLRLSGNGLLTHVALTATARYFSGDRGQALALVVLGTSIGEAGFPAVLVTLIGAWGWRWTEFGTGCLGLALVIAAAGAVRNNLAFRTPESRSTEVSAAGAAHSGARQSRDHRRYFAWTSPLFIAMPLVITAMIFHQALMAEAKDVSLQWFAVSFIAFAIVRVPFSVLTGRIVDHIGSAWLFCIHLLPLTAGIAALITLSSPWVVPLYWLCAGVTVGMGTVLQTTVIAERIAPERLGTARSLVGAATIVASAVGPSLYGVGLAAGATIPAILWVCVAGLLGTTLIGVIATRQEKIGPESL